MGGIKGLLCAWRKPGSITSSGDSCLTKPENGADNGLENVHPASSSLRGGGIASGRQSNR